MWLRDIDILSADDLSLTVDQIASIQLPNGMVPWVPDGHADAWNHSEALMALSIGGRRAEAERGFDWLQSLQRPDGAWHQYYLADRVEQDKLDANCCAYVATAVWHHWLLWSDRESARSDVADGRAGDRLRPRVADPTRRDPLGPAR